jgi:hypothetical protein
MCAEHVVGRPRSHRLGELAHGNPFQKPRFEDSVILLAETTREPSRKTRAGAAGS